MRILVGMMPMEVTPHLAMPVRVSRTELASNALQGARHAVLTTLYSRAHRIGLDGASCLLDDLRKSSSFNFFVVVVILEVLSESTTIFSFLVSTRCQTSCLTNSWDHACDRAKRRREVLARAGATHETFGRLVRKKVGSLPPNLPFFARCLSQGQWLQSF